MTTTEKLAEVRARSERALSTVQIILRVNELDRLVDLDPYTSLLDTLREHLK